MNAAVTVFDDGTPVPTALLLPGWRDSGPMHWQSRWQTLYGFQRVEQADWEWPRRGDWMARLDEVLLAHGTAGDPVADGHVLVAHSLGCHLVAAWAAHSRHVAAVSAALLVAPPDLARDDLPPQLAPWRPAVRERLPFPACAVISSDDPFAQAARACALAADWGADVADVGPRGHLNGDSGLGDWPEGIALLRALLARVRGRHKT